MNVLVWYFALDKNVVPEPIRAVRPRDVMERRRAAETSRRVRAELESGGWEEL